MARIGAVQFAERNMETDIFLGRHSLSAMTAAGFVKNRAMHALFAQSENSSSGREFHPFLKG
jgi:hypothetical protein